MELNNRQKELLNYLKIKYKEAIYVTKKQICKDLPYAYPRHLENHNNEGNKSRAFSNISADIRALNNSDLEQIIVSTKKGYKIATEKEAKEYLSRRFKRDLKSLKLNYKLNQKIKLDNQLYISDDEIRVFKTFLGG